MTSGDTSKLWTRAALAVSTKPLSWPSPPCDVAPVRRETKRTSSLRPDSNAPSMPLVPSTRNSRARSRIPRLRSLRAR